MRKKGKGATVNENGSTHRLLTVRRPTPTRTPATITKKRIPRINKEQLATVQEEVTADPKPTSEPTSQYQSTRYTHSVPSRQSHDMQRPYDGETGADQYPPPGKPGTKGGKGAGKNHPPANPHWQWSEYPHDQNPYASYAPNTHPEEWPKPPHPGQDWYPASNSVPQGKGDQVPKGKGDKGGGKQQKKGGKQQKKAAAAQPVPAPVPAAVPPAQANGTFGKLNPENGLLYTHFNENKEPVKVQ